MRRMALMMTLGLLGGLGSVATPAVATTIVRAPLHGHSIGRATVGSTNWSGYATYNGKFTDVKGSWTQPTATCNTSGHKYASFWVGLDGYNSNSVEQLGTDSDCANRNKPQYYAWYEMYPAASVSLSTSQYPVRPGDSMSAEVSTTASTFTLTMKNASRNWTFTTTQNSATAQDSSAEWVAEAPSSCFIQCSVLPLANFGTVNFTASATTGNGAVGTIKSFTNDEIVMVTNSGAVKAQPSVLNATGDSFSDTWHHS